MVADIDPAVPSRLPWPGSRYPPRPDNLVVMAESGYQGLISRPTSVTWFALWKPRPPVATPRRPTGGGDYGVMSAFLDAVSAGDLSLVRSGPRESLESHLMAFAAERSRLTGAPVRVWD